MRVCAVWWCSEQDETYALPVMDTVPDPCMTAGPGHRGLAALGAGRGEAVAEVPGVEEGRGLEAITDTKAAEKPVEVMEASVANLTVITPPVDRNHVWFSSEPLREARTGAEMEGPSNRVT